MTPSRTTRVAVAACSSVAALALSAPVATAGAGGAAAPTAQDAASGGAEYGTPLATPVPPRPVASLFRVSPSKVTAGGRLPAIKLRITERDMRSVRARLVFQPVGGRGTLLRVDLGTVSVGTTVTARWPSGSAVAAGEYVVRLHAKDQAGTTLLRQAHTSGRSALVVKAPAPKPSTTTPAPAPAPVLTPVTIGGTPGVFPVAGPHTFGGDDARFGAGRKGHIHQGQDVVADSGIPVVAPLAGTISVRANQPSGAGYYLVEVVPDGRSFFFAHCQHDSWAVHAGDAVAAGQQLCRVGATGDASGPHLHFEMWIGGWRVDKNSHPVDPLPQLQEWDR